MLSKDEAIKAFGLNQQQIKKIDQFIFEIQSYNKHVNIVGSSTWNSEYSDIIAMGDDGFEWTADYCLDNEEILIETSSSNEQLYIIQGQKYWHGNNFEIITLSNYNFGDVDFNQSLNVSDIILIIEHIISDSIFNTEHQNLLADINQDNAINISDIIILIEEILN